jgi:hypothetical protein
MRKQMNVSVGDEGRGRKRDKPESDFEMKR